MSWYQWWYAVVMTLTCTNWTSHFYQLVITWEHTTFQIPWPINVVWGFKSRQSCTVILMQTWDAEHKRLWQGYFWKCRHCFSRCWWIFPCSIMCRSLPNVSVIRSGVKKLSDTFIEESYKFDISLSLFWRWRHFIFCWGTHHFRVIKLHLNMSAFNNILLIISLPILHILLER